MFGMGFSELLIIAVIAILFLGPDKLPSAIVDIAKFFRSFKQTMNSVKASINDEIQLDDIKKEAEAYKQQLLEAQTKVNATVNLNSLESDITALIENETKIQPEKKQNEIQEDISDTSVSTLKEKKDV